MNSRLDTDDYFMGIAFVTSLRSVCTKRKVGAVIVENKQVLATGYNGPPSKFKHCTVEECPRKDANTGEMLESCKAIHAEANCIIQCAKHGTIIGNEAVLYSTFFPCTSCLKMIVNAGIKKIVYCQDYDMDNPIKKSILEESKIEIKKLEKVKVMVTLSEKQDEII